MSRDKAPVTPAVRALRQAGIAFTGHLYRYQEGGGTARFAEEYGVDEHQVIKTLIMEDDRRRALVVLMHGDRQVSTQALARTLGVRAVIPCQPDVAQRHSGYLVGGTSPFGLRNPLPIYYEASIAALERLYINGGKRGYILSLAPAAALALLAARPVQVARD
jgi:Cys-tRNA(Pro) deacylase